MYSAQPANDDEQESEQVRLIVLDGVHSEEMKSVILKWALNKGKNL